MNGNDITITDGLKWSKEIHDFMTVTQGNAWNYWWGACYKTYNGEGLIQMDMNSKTYKVAKRLYTIGQYARFIRPGWQRISATANPVSGVYITAYKDPSTGNFAIVAMNNSSTGQSVTYTLNGFSPASVTPYTTSAAQNLAEGAKIAVSGSSFTGTLAANSITTFAGSINSNQEIYGDVNGDRVVDALDFALVKQYLTGQISSFPSPDGIRLADVNRDNSVDALDLAILKKYLLGEIKSLPVN